MDWRFPHARYLDTHVIGSLSALEGVDCPLACLLPNCKHQALPDCSLQLQLRVFTSNVSPLCRLMITHRDRDESNLAGWTFSTELGYGDPIDIACHRTSKQRLAVMKRNGTRDVPAAVNLKEFSPDPKDLALVQEPSTTAGTGAKPHGAFVALRGENALDSDLGWTSPVATVAARTLAPGKFH